jgi:hypothetical protein
VHARQSLSIGHDIRRLAGTSIASTESPRVWVEPGANGTDIVQVTGGDAGIEMAA